MTEILKQASADAIGQHADQIALALKALKQNFL